MRRRIALGTAAVGLTIIIAATVGVFALEDFFSPRTTVPACGPSGDCALLFYFNSVNCTVNASISCAFGVIYHGTGPSWSLSNALLTIDGPGNLTTITATTCGQPTNTTDVATVSVPCGTETVPNSEETVNGNCGSGSHSREQNLTLTCNFDAAVPHGVTYLVLALYISDGSASGTIVQKELGYYTG